jgi:probable rRNA maturation factor
MSVVVDVAAEPGCRAIPRTLASRAARAVLRSARVRDAVLSVTFVSDTTIARLNRRHLGRRGPTDVLAFAFDPDGTRGAVVGDVYVGVDAARRAATLRRIPVRQELVRLVVHGTLHVLGYDHPEDDSREASEMWRQQERLVTRVLAVGAG